MSVVTSTWSSCMVNLASPSTSPIRNAGSRPDQLRRQPVFIRQGPHQLRFAATQVSQPFWSLMAMSRSTPVGACPEGRSSAGTTKQPSFAGGLLDGSCATAGSTVCSRPSSPPSSPATNSRLTSAEMISGLSIPAACTRTSGPPGSRSRSETGPSTTSRPSPSPPTRRSARRLRGRDPAMSQRPGRLLHAHATKERSNQGRNDLVLRALMSDRFLCVGWRRSGAGCYVFGEFPCSGAHDMVTGQGVAERHLSVAYWPVHD